MTVVLPNLKLVTDFLDGQAYGTDMNANLRAIDAASAVSVKAHGALGNGVTDDTAAINSAIVAAENAGGVVLFPPSADPYISAVGGHVVKKTTRIIGHGAKLLMTHASNTLLTFGSGNQPGEPAGGIYGLALQGNGGGSDTSIGLQLGNSTHSADYMTFAGAQVSNFGHGLVFTNNANDRIWFDGCLFITNAYNGVRIDTTFANEPCGFVNCAILSNGLAQATGAGIQFGTNGAMALNMINCKIHQNGNGTLGQIYGPATGQVFLRLTDVDIESIDSFERMAIQLLGVGNDRCQVYLKGFIAGDECSGTITKPLMLFASVDLWMDGCRLVKKVGSTIVPHIDIGNSETNKENFVALHGVKFETSGTVANAQAIKWTGTGGQYSGLSVTGSTLAGWDTATNVVSFPDTLRVKHDLVRQKPGLQALTHLRLLWDPDISREVDFNLDMLTFGAAATNYPLKLSYMDGQVGTKIPWVTNGINGGDAGRDGMIVIEDNGGSPRDVNLVIYLGGLRFKVDMGAAF